MSVLATFPRFVQMEQKSGSLIRGMLASLKNRPQATLSGPPPKPGTPRMTYFMSFKTRHGDAPASVRGLYRQGLHPSRRDGHGGGAPRQGMATGHPRESARRSSADHVMLGTARPTIPRNGQGIRREPRRPDERHPVVLIGNGDAGLQARGREGPAPRFRLHRAEGRGPQDQCHDLQLHQVVLSRAGRHHSAPRLRGRRTS